MTENTGWDNFAWDELGDFGPRFAELKADMVAAYARDMKVETDRIRISFSKYGIGFLISDSAKAAKAAKRTLGQGTPAAKPKSFGPRSPRLK